MPLNPSYTLLGAVALAPSTWRRPRLGLALLSDGIGEPLDAGSVQRVKAAITPYGQTQLAV